MSYTIETDSKGKAVYTFDESVTLDDIESRKLKVEFIRFKLRTDNMWATRGLARIFENQTADEQVGGQTIERNGIGFQSCDAAQGSYWGDSAVKYRKQGRAMNDNQLRKPRTFLHRYADQLLRYIESQEESAS